LLPRQINQQDDESNRYDDHHQTRAIFAFCHLLSP
jgi:hypothetical protein